MFKALTSRVSAMVLLVAGLVVLYVAVPLWVNFAVAPDRYFTYLAVFTAVAVVAIAVGFHISWFDRRFEPTAVRLKISEPVLQAAVWLSFASFLLVVLITAESIPLLSALRGATAETLSVERGAFLKTRSGWQAILPYLSTIYMGALLPYATVRLFVRRHWLRFAAIAFFTAYTLLALEKAAFVFALGPLIYLAAVRRNPGMLAGLIGFSLGLLYLNTVLARGVDELTPMEAKLILEGKKPAKARPESGAYFSAKYIPTNAIDHIVWRSVSVPVFTAADALRVFDQKFGGAYFLGTTSTFVAKATGRERVNYDAEVFGYQYGHGEIGRANSVYFTEAYVNFGWLGVMAFSLFVGQALRWLHNSGDPALQAMWPLFCWFVFMAGLMGTLLSNGYVLIFALALFGRVDPMQRPQANQGGSASLPS